MSKKTIIAASPFMKEPHTEPYRVILVMVEDSKGGRTFHTHREDAQGNCFWGHYFLHDFNKAYTDWANLTLEQINRYKEGIVERGSAYLPWFKQEAYPPP